ncbi:UDP-N-acetylmuramoyl-tripeptide--D-alanyl-D-alanine ligase [Proteocatella sphenisci]|uniref:UDP-N-acetylmuramoyl-tripeptide--D-alanyl-D- alanine ligase n=1 Tax=Proteocatella sphenisci TaxID=181070 RepID=UPI00048F484D|nr:UDP-N-acetylmuramoyl-tripeptide--D-alanyl-D-alanine ligase [Proteocatella sphenisci]
MQNMTVGHILEMTGGKTNFDIDKNIKVNKISHDSREIEANDIYAAIVGERLDGHQFAETALKNGALAVIVEKKSTEKDILVEDTRLALKKIAMGYRKMFDIPFVSVTGSSGKTTTKDMLYFAISQSLNTLRNIGNLNSEIGLPMTVYNLDSSHECAILEMGMYVLGEIDYLAEIVKPDFAIITNVGVAHIQSAGSRENILKAKMEIANYMDENDFLLINGDNDMLKTIDKKSLIPSVFTFGIEDHNDIRLVSYESSNNKMLIKAEILGEQIEYEIPTVGVHNIYNSLSVMGLCKLMGLDMIKSAQGISKYQPSKYRMEIKKIAGKTIVEDYYNANPDSVKASIETFGQMQGERKVAILADMLELGEMSKHAHMDAGAQASEIFDVIICIGKDAKHIEKGALEKDFQKNNIYFFKNNQEALSKINSILRPGDVILIKGSRGMKLEEVAESIC